MSPTARLGAVRALALLLAAVVLGSASTGTPAGGSAIGDGSFPPLKRTALCDYPPEKAVPASSPQTIPPAIAAIAKQVEVTRGLEFLYPVIPEAVDPPTITRLLEIAEDASLPTDLESRRSQAWATIGVIPRGTELRQALLDYYTTQVVGFYDTLSHRLVFEASRVPTPLDLTILAHELTHALDDQHFDLSRQDRLTLTCQDERAAAFSSLAEGDAVETSSRWGAVNLTEQQRGLINAESIQGVPSPLTIPPFVLQMQEFPYLNGPRFVEALLASGGESAVDAAFRHPPTSTEQILHPARYPGDVPVRVTIPNLAADFGSRWKLVDQMDVGEGFLRLLLGLRLRSNLADTAAAGWGGGEYRAWSDGVREAVLIKTVWDSGSDADQFAAAMRDWLAEAPRPVVVEQRGLAVNVLLGSDAPTLRRLKAAVG